ncbi:MAG TPA: DUF418 domain-containing protein [Lysobacter sp.]
MSGPDLHSTQSRVRSSATTLRPPIAADRAEWVDALRGFALLGIVLYNIEVFSGVAFRGLMPDLRPIGAALDPAIEFIAHWLVQGKFYSLFSFLFGLGIALQLQQAQAAGTRGVSVLRRRLGWLFVFGLAHSLLLWFGDILTVYALLGFGLLLARHLSTPALLVTALAFLASPLPIYLLFMAFGVGDPLAGDPAQPPEQSMVGKAVQAIRTGSYIEVVQGQAVFYPGGWLRRAIQLALPRIFGMFLLGAWAARVGLPRLDAPQQVLLRAWLGCGAAFGLPLSLALAIAGGNQAMFPVGPHGLLVVALATISMPLLCLGYVAAFGLYWRAPRPRSLLVSAGRTGLSHYLGQSLLCVLMFYGYGLGLFGHFGYGVALLVALSVFLVLGLAGRWWLQRFAQGPAEALWRRLSVGRAQPART